MVRLRLARLGAKENPFYRVVASDSRSPRNGRFIEKLGFYDPKSNPIVVTLDLSRVDYWLSVGAQPSEEGGIMPLGRGLDETSAETIGAWIDGGATEDCGG